MFGRIGIFTEAYNVARGIRKSAANPLTITSSFNWTSRFSLSFNPATPKKQLHQLVEYSETAEYHAEVVCTMTILRLQTTTE